MTFGEPRKTTFGQILTCAVILVILGAILIPVDTGSRPSKAILCLSNLKQAALATAMYSNDWDNRLPPSHAWYDVEDPYRKARLRCSEIPELFDGRGTVGYAMNQWLDRVPETCVSDPAKTVLEYDSSSLKANACDTVKSLVSGGRHHGRNNVAYADYHVKGVTWPMSPGIRNPRIDGQCFLTGKLKVDHPPRVKGGGSK